MQKQLITFFVLSSFAAQGDVLTSTQRFFGMGGQYPEYVDENSEVPRTATGQVPYSPADSDLGVQEVLVERASAEPINFDLKTSLYRTDNAPGGGVLGDDSSWVSSSRMSVTWRPHIVNGFFADVGLSQDMLRYDRSSAIDFENTDFRAGVYKNLPDLDDTVLFARYEYQRITFNSLRDGVYNSQRIRTGLQKSVWAAPRHQFMGSVTGAFEWSTHPSTLERDEYAMDAAYRYSITETIYTLASARIARSNFDEFGRDDWTFGAGFEVVWQFSPNLRATAAVYYDKNDSDTFGDFNEYEAWTGGLGLGLQWSF